MIPIPIILGGGGGKTSTITLLIRQLLNILAIAFIVLAVFILFFVLIKIYFILKTSRIREIRQAMLKLYSDEVIIKKCFDRKQDLESFFLAKQETITFIENKINKRCFVKKIGKSSLNRIAHGLRLIKNDEIDFEGKKLLIKSYLDIFSSV